MTALVLGAGWCVLVLWGAVLPRSGGVLYRLEDPSIGRAERAAPTAPLRRGMVSVAATASERVGEALSTLLGLHLGAEARGGLGRAVVVAVALVGVSPTAALAGGLLAGALPSLLAGRRESRRRAAVDRVVPELCELVVVAVRAGASPRTALDLVATWPPPPLADALARLRRGFELGDPLDDQLAALAAVSPAVARFCRAMGGAVASGASVASTLTQLAAEGRRERRQQAQASARRLPIALLFPLTFCILPAFGLLTVGPAIAVGLRSLQP